MRLMATLMIVIGMLFLSACESSPSEGGPPVRCNPTATPPETCPSGQPCPKCGRAACNCPAGPGPPPNPGPPSGSSMYSCSNASVTSTKGGSILANATVFDGRLTNGCSACDCCHDYISDCDQCVMMRCLANATAHYECLQDPRQGKIDNQRHKPVPACIRTSSTGTTEKAQPLTLGGGRQQTFPKGKFNSSDCSMMCGDGIGPDTLTNHVLPPLPAGTPICAERSPFPLPQPANGPSSDWASNCTVCQACCRDDVDCGKCVAERCPPPGVWHVCKASGGRHKSTACVAGLPVWPFTGTYFASPDCNKTCTAGVPPATNNSYKCYGAECRLIPGNYPAGDHPTGDCSGACGKPPAPPAPPKMYKCTTVCKRSAPTPSLRPCFSVLIGYDICLHAGTTRRQSRLSATVTARKIQKVTSRTRHVRASANRRRRRRRRHRRRL